MASKSDGSHKKVMKTTCQNGSKSSTRNKRNQTKKYRGQGR